MAAYFLDSDRLEHHWFLPLGPSDSEGSSGGDPARYTAMAHGDDRAGKCYSSSSTTASIRSYRYPPQLEAAPLCAPPVRPYLPTAAASAAAWSSPDRLLDEPWQRGPQAFRDVQHMPAQPRAAPMRRAIVSEEVLRGAPEQFAAPPNFLDSVLASAAARERPAAGPGAGGRGRPPGPGARPAGSLSSDLAQYPCLGAEAAMPSPTRFECALEAAARSLPLTNPGSQGHPGLCTRPCIFYARGECTSGAECAYCHGPHETRCVRLDKMGRDSFKRMHFAQRVSLALPALRQHVKKLGLGPEADRFLEQLQASAGPCAEEGADAGWQPPSSARHKLAKSLAALSFRSILAHVCRGEDTPAWLQGAPLHAALGRIVAGIGPIVFEL